MPENDGAEKYLIFRLPLRFNQKITEKEVSLTKDFFFFVVLFFYEHIRIGTSHKIPGGNRMHGLQQKVFEQYYGNDSYMPHIFTAVPKLLLTSFLILVGSIKSKDPSLSQSPFFDMMSRTLAGSICKYRKRF